MDEDGEFSGGGGRGEVLDRGDLGGGADDAGYVPGAAEEERGEVLGDFAVAA